MKYPVNKYTYTVKKVYRFTSPQRGFHLPNSPWAGIIKLLPARERLVSDIPAGDGKINKLFSQCTAHISGPRGDVVRRFLPYMLVTRYCLARYGSRYGSGEKLTHSKGPYLRESRGDFHQTSPALDPLRAL